MALYHKWDIKNGFAYALQFFSLISGGVIYLLKKPTSFTTVIPPMRDKILHCVWWEVGQAQCLRILH